MCFVGCACLLKEVCVEGELCMIELAQQNAGTAGSGKAGCLARPFHCRERRFQTNPCVRRLSKLRSSAGLLAPCLALLAGSGLLFAQTADMLRTAMPGPSIEGSITILDQDGRVNTVPGVLVNLTASPSATAPINRDRHRGPLPLHQPLTRHLHAGCTPRWLHAVYRKRRSQSGRG